MFVDRVVEADIVGVGAWPKAARLRIYGERDGPRRSRHTSRRRRGGELRTGGSGPGPTRMKLGCDRIPVCGRSFFGAIGQLRVARCEIFVTECERDHTWKGKVMHLRMTGGPLRSSDPSQENRHENTSHCCRFWSRCGVARFCPARQRTPSPAKVQLVAVECPPAMGAQPKQFRRSKLRRISAVGELIGSRDCFERRDRRAPPLPNEAGRSARSGAATIFGGSGGASLWRVWPPR